MAKVIMHRALPFQRGDMSITISLDGKPAGKLLANNSVEIEAAPGLHQLQASSNGMRGRKYELELTGQGEVQLQVHMPRTKFFWWPVVVTSVVFGIPQRVFGSQGFWVQMALCVLINVICIYLLRPELTKRLRIEPLPDEASATQSAPAAH